MNQELINKINEAIKNNDIATIEKLKKDYNLTISTQKINMSDFKTTNISINNSNIPNIIQNVRLVSRAKIDPTDMVQNRENSYYRDIPCNNNLFIIYYLASNHKLLTQESDMIGAFLLHWFKNNKISFESIKKGLFKKQKLLIKFKNDIYIEDSLERQLYDFLKNISVDNILEFDELYNWVKKYEFEFNNFLQNIKFSCLNKLIAEGLLVNDNNSIENKPIINQEINENKNIYKVTKVSTKKHILTAKYHEYLNQIVDFKNFLQDFSNIDNKEFRQVALWQDYLVVAQLLGLANTVSKQLDELIPGFKVKNKYKIKKEQRIRITVPGNIPREQIDEYLKNEITKTNKF